MGKILVLKDADFSQNGIEPTTTWYIDRCQSISLLDANRVNGGWAFHIEDNALLQNKPINRIKMIPSKVGVMNIYKTSNLTGPVTLVASFNITSDQLNVITEFPINTFELNSNEFFVLGEANNVSGFKYTTAFGTGFYSRIPSNPQSGGVYDLNISIGYKG